MIDLITLSAVLIGGLLFVIIMIRHDKMQSEWIDQIPKDEKLLHDYGFYCKCLPNINVRSKIIYHNNLTTRKFNEYK